jgi:hypothetical protein
MTVASDLAELKRMAAASSPESDGSLAALGTIPSVFAFVAAAAKAEKRDPAHDVELLARHGEMSAPEVRGIATVLRRLGYQSAADRLAEIAGRRRIDLRPLKLG